MVINLISLYPKTSVASTIASISSGANHSLALRSDGTVLAWGNNDSGQCTVPVPAQAQVSAVAAGWLSSFALLNGAVIGWGDNSHGQTDIPDEAQSGVTAIAAGGTFALALKSGDVIAWGDNFFGQTSVPAEAQSDVIAISAGYAHALALKSDGSVVAWGANFSSQADVPVAALSGVKAIAAGATHSLALKKDGSVIAWGDASLSATTVPAAAQSGISAIAAGANFSIALKGTTAIMWGDTSAGSTPGDWNTATAIAAGGSIASAIAGSGYASTWGTPGGSSRFLVTLLFSGTGAGSVNSSPSGLNCVSGPCQAAYDNGSTITLTAAPSAGSHFSGWQQSASCSGTGPCTWALTADTILSAAFDQDPARACVLQAGTVYPLIMQAYAAALNGNTIQVIKGVTPEDLVLDESKQVELKGGYEQAFDTRTGRTYLTGTITIRNGKVVINNVSIRKP